MSQTKVQLIQPIGVVTATTLETTGVLTATTFVGDIAGTCLLYTSPSPRDGLLSRMPSSA